MENVEITVFECCEAISRQITIVINKLFQATVTLLISLQCHVPVSARGSCFVYMEDWPLPTVRDSGDFGVLCTFTSIWGIWNCQKLAAEQLLARADGTVRRRRLIRLSITVYKSGPLHCSPPAKLDRTPCWVDSLRPSTSVISGICWKISR